MYLLHVTFVPVTKYGKVKLNIVFHVFCHLCWSVRGRIVVYSWGPAYPFWRISTGMISLNDTETSFICAISFTFHTNYSYSKSILFRVSLVFGCFLPFTSSITIPEGIFCISLHSRRNKHLLGSLCSFKIKILFSCWYCQTCDVAVIVFCSCSWDPYFNKKYGPYYSSFSVE